MARKFKVGDRVTWHVCCGLWSYGEVVRVLPDGYEVTDPQSPLGTVKVRRPQTPPEDMR